MVRSLLHQAEVEVVQRLVPRSAERARPPPLVVSRQVAGELLSDKQPSRRFVAPEQLGDTLAFLCSPAADQITGAAIAVDGGWTAQWSAGG